MGAGNIRGWMETIAIRATVVHHMSDLRFHIQLAESVNNYLSASAADETVRVNRARSLSLGETKDEVLDAEFKAIAGPTKWLAFRNELQATRSVL
jgi:hypothetical protein